MTVGELIIGIGLSIFAFALAYLYTKLKRLQQIHEFWFLTLQNNEHKTHEMIEHIKYLIREEIHTEIITGNLARRLGLSKGWGVEDDRR